MTSTSQSSLGLTFPKAYERRFREYRKRKNEILTKPRRIRRPPSPTVFSNSCKQAISIAKKVYCCVLKEPVERALCRSCPCYEAEPLDYSLFRRE